VSEPAFTTLGLGRRSPAAVYHLMTALIVPRPIALVTSLSEDGVLNAAPFSFFNGLCADPPLLMISVARRPDRLKDTALNILRQGEFVVNLPDRQLATIVEGAAAELPPEVSEVERLGLATLPSLFVAPARLAAAPAQLECRLEQALELGNGPVDLLIGRILEAHLRADLLDGQGRIDVAAFDPLARLSAGSYAGIGTPFKPA
jgi:flavin reductase (DIM6/NTAB) family NADH-FMN oxidoreductase RutF